MVADKLMLLAKIAELDECIRELRVLQGYTMDEFKKSRAKLWSVAHGLQLAIQIMLDTGNHLLADLGIRTMDYTDVIDKLGEHGIIPAEFAGNIRGMAGFRNIIVHGYSILNIDTVYQVLHNNLEDITDFSRHIIAYIKNN
jgi:uncharacterized protein YutE (UPF0331/DUF86 family)